MNNLITVCKAAVITVGLLVMILTAVALCSEVGARKLEPDTRTIEIREVKNGYVVSFRPKNNPYPVIETIAASPEEAGKQAVEYLNQPMPKRWATQ
jgi:hypothetical protein